tara:strand:+ start:1539 stop:1994 length:456 start_codon:yes stop_codon:yes gene_type:complete
MPIVDPTDFVKGLPSDDTPIPPGDYVVKVADIELRDGKKAPYYNIRLKIAEGDLKGRTVFDIVSTSENARWKWSDFVHAIMYVKPFDPIAGFDDMAKAALKCGGFWVELGPEKNPSPGDEDRVRVLRFLWKKQAKMAQLNSDQDVDDEIPF